MVVNNIPLVIAIVDYFIRSILCTNIFGMI